MKKNKTSLSPSLRRRILARDKFTCTECGKQVPRVYLYIDRILSTGTAEELGDIPEEDKYTCLCESCSRKHRHKLQTHGLVTPSERRAQLDLLIAWRREEETLSDVAFDIILDYIRPQIKPAYLYKAQKTKIRNYLKTYDILDILNAIDTSVAKYARFEGDDCLQDSVEEIVSKMGGILYNNTLGPIDSEVSHIRHICRKNFQEDYNDRDARTILHEFIEYLRHQGITEEAKVLVELADKPKRLAGQCGTFEQWCRSMQEYLPEQENKEPVTSSITFEEQPVESQSYRNTMSDYELFVNVELDLKNIQGVLKTLHYIYQESGCYTRERWNDIVEYLRTAASDFLDNQYYRLQDSFDVPEPEPIREAIRPFFNRWEYDQRLTGVKGVLPDNGCDPDIRRVLVHHVLSDLAYTLFTFFDTFSNGYEHDATFKNITLLQEKFQQVFESSREDALVPSRMYFDNPDEPFEF